MIRAFIFAAMLLVFAPVPARAVLFLLAYTDRIVTDPDENTQRVYKRGDVVEVRPDTSAIGNLERNGYFWLVEVTGLSYQDALQYAAVWNDANGTMVRKRRWFADWDSFTSGEQTNMETAHRNGTVFQLSWSVVRAKFFDKETGLNP